LFRSCVEEGATGRLVVFDRVVFEAGDAGPVEAVPRLTFCGATAL
jgi:hypothetical protein